MNESHLASAEDTFLIGIAFVFTVLLAVFRLGGIFARPKTALRHRRPGFGLDDDERAILMDPDGRTTSKPRKRK